jgi:hypothetical protein
VLTAGWPGTFAVEQLNIPNTIAIDKIYFIIILIT